MKRVYAEGGFTLIEVLITLFLLGIVTTTMYQLLFTQAQGSRVAQSVSQDTQEARLGLNRMIRDTRQADTLSDANADAGYTVVVNYEGADQTETFAYDAGAKQITLNNQPLVKQVTPVSGTPMFGYTSNVLACDSNGDGLVTAAELDQAPSNSNICAGNGDGQLDYPELSFVSNIAYAFQVNVGNRALKFYGQAELRNRR